MKHLFFIFLAAIVITSCNSSAGERSGNSDLEALRKDSSKFTTIQWLDSSLSFGTKKMGDVVNLTFRCKNTGDKPLYLITVRPSCGCTVADYTKEPIMPGQQGSVEAQFDTKKSHPGDIHKVIYVTANNSNKATGALTFSGNIVDDTLSIHKTDLTIPQ